MPILYILAFGVALLTSCGSDEPWTAARSPSLERLLSDTGSGTVSIGRSTDTSSAYVFASIVGARVAAGGEFIVVLDNVAPYVHVFRSDGSIHSIFGKHGGGPGELKRPYALAASEDSLLLVLQSSRLSFFDLDGTVRYEHPRAELGFSPLTATSGCGNRWFLYGPQFASGHRVRNGWLHSMVIDSSNSLQTTILYRDADVPRIRAYGKLYGFAATENGGLLYHENGRPPALISWDCKAGAADMHPVSTRIPRPGEATLMAIENGTMAVGVLTYPDTVLAGIGATKRGVLWSMIIRPDPHTTRTEYFLLTDDSVYGIATRGRFVLRDVRHGKVLLSTSQPFPRVIVVDQRAFIDAIVGTRER